MTNAWNMKVEMNFTIEDYITAYDDMQLLRGLLEDQCKLVFKNRLISYKSALKEAHPTINRPQV